MIKCSLMTQEISRSWSHRPQVQAGLSYPTSVKPPALPEVGDSGVLRPDRRPA